MISCELLAMLLAVYLRYLLPMSAVATHASVWMPGPVHCTPTVAADGLPSAVLLE